MVSPVGCSRWTTPAREGLALRPTEALADLLNSQRFCRFEFDGAGAGLRRGPERGPAANRIHRAVRVDRAATVPTGRQHTLDQWNTEQSRTRLCTFKRLKGRQANRAIAATGARHATLRRESLEGATRPVWYRRATRLQVP
jgi:hypothetical protein